MRIDVEDVRREQARRNLIKYASRIYPTNVWKDFHVVYYQVLDMFAKQLIKNLIITMPPQHGKSEGSTRILPSYVLGDRPNTKIAIASYSSTFAKKFNRQVQRIINSEEYERIFPETFLADSPKASQSSIHVQTSEEFEVVDKKGSLKAIGRNGSLTGDPVDLMIMDDLYKSSIEGNSPVIRRQVTDLYTSVIQKRLHNNSQQLIVFTRWHEEDLIGFIEETSDYVECGSFEEILAAIEQNPDVWIKINFEAIKESGKTDFDVREMGVALWEDRHGIKKLTVERRRNEHEFNCMNQGNPMSKEGLLYGDFKRYSEIPVRVIKKGNCTDTADKGRDYLNSVCYDVVLNDQNEKRILVTDMVYNQEAMKVNEKKVPLMLLRCKTREMHIESNNGGEGFGRRIEEAVPFVDVLPFHQSGNKESRIITNNTGVTKFIEFPIDWEDRFPEHHKHITKYKRDFIANSFHDSADVLTMIYEKEILEEYDVLI